MKALWIVLAILGVVVLACVGGVFFLTKGIAGVNDAADRFATESIQLIAKDWSTASIESRLSDAAKSDWPRDKLDKYLRERGQQLGSLQNPPEFRSFEFKVESNGGASTARVATRALAKFERGSAGVIFRLSKTNDVWKIDFLSIEKT